MGDENPEEKLFEQLLPCPFCGSLPEWVNEVHPSQSPGIKCHECQFIIVHDRKDKTLYHWNKRVVQGNSQKDVGNVILKPFCLWRGFFVQDYISKS